MWLAADRDGLRQVFRSQRRQRVEQHAPAALPVLHHRVARRERVDELAVAVAIRLLAVARQEIREPRPQVAGHVLHDDGDAVRVRVERRAQLLVRQLHDRPLRQALLRLEVLDDRVEEHARCVGCAHDVTSAAPMSSAFHASRAIRAARPNDATQLNMIHAPHSKNSRSAVLASSTAARNQRFVNSSGRRDPAITTATIDVAAKTKPQATIALCSASPGFAMLRATRRSRPNTATGAAALIAIAMTMALASHS